MSHKKAVANFNWIEQTNNFFLLQKAWLTLNLTSASFESIRLAWQPGVSFNSELSWRSVLKDSDSSAKIPIGQDKKC